jgi:glutathione peroxidase-family protein
MSVTTKFKKHINLLRNTVEGQVDLDHQYPKVFRKVTKYYREKGVKFVNDPCNDYEILLDCLYADLVTEGIINE